MNVFGYGSLRLGLGSGSFPPKGRHLGFATVRGTLWEISNTYGVFAGLSESSDAEAVVYGDVYVCSDAEMEVLDRREGVHANPPYYERR